MSDAQPEQPTPDGPSLGPNESASQELGGSGEWPETDSPPTDAAPGTDPARAEAIEERREADADPDRIHRGTTSSTSQAATDETGDHHPGQAGAARTEEIDSGNAAEYGKTGNFKDVLNADPVRGGSSSVNPEGPPPR